MKVYHIKDMMALIASKYIEKYILYTFIYIYPFEFRNTAFRKPMIRYNPK